MSDLRRLFSSRTHGLASLRWLLAEWDCNGHTEAWFSEVLRKYNERNARALERRGAQMTNVARVLC